jgi:hypothetical protein
VCQDIQPLLTIVCYSNFYHCRNEIDTSAEDTTSALIAEAVAAATLAANVEGKLDERTLH